MSPKAALKEACRNFAEAAAPYLPIRDDAHYEEALALIESLLEEAEDSPDDPLNAVVDVLGRAIESYENRDDELVAFERGALEQPADLALLRLLVAQHQLGTVDLPRDRVQVHGVPGAVGRAQPEQEAHRGAGPAVPD